MKEDLGFFLQFEQGLSKLQFFLVALALHVFATSTIGTMFFLCHIPYDQAKVELVKARF